jgi:hypothetical protein
MRKKPVIDLDTVRDEDLKEVLKWYTSFVTTCPSERVIIRAGKEKGALISLHELKRLEKLASE